MSWRSVDRCCTQWPEGCRRHKRRGRTGRSASGVLPLVLDGDPVAESRVDGTVTGARKVDRLVHHLVGEVAGPTGDEGDVDLREAARPVCFLLSFDLHLQRGKGLL